MRKLIPLFLLFSASVFAADGKVVISAPADGASVDAKAKITVSYEVTPGPGGDHSHLYVDGKQAEILRELKGNYSLDPLPAGRHDICIKIVTRSHTPTGVEKCVKISSK